MIKQSQIEIDQLIQRAQVRKINGSFLNGKIVLFEPTSRDLVRRDVNQAIFSPLSSLVLRVAEYYYTDGTSKELLCLHGTVACHYKGNRYNIPIEICLQQDHPKVPPLAYVRPTSDMFVSQSSTDVQPDGTVVIPYIKNWHHV